MSEGELERIRAAYANPDASSETPYRWSNPGYVTYMQLLERSLLRALEDTATPLAGARVLDVGCGTGYFLHRLSDYGASECHGIDLVADRIEAARDRYPGQTWHLGSATELPFPDGSFDLVTQFTCLSSIVDNATRAAAAREMLRVAGRDGRVLSFDMRVGSRPDSPGTPTVGLDDDALRTLFGEPRLLRRVALRFDLAQVAGRHALIAQALALARPLRHHVLGVWAGRAA
jgi:SAM-dependent methyltransferase